MTLSIKYKDTAPILIKLDEKQSIEFRPNIFVTVSSGEYELLKKNSLFANAFAHGLFEVSDGIAKNTTLAEARKEADKYGISWAYSDKVEDIQKKVEVKKETLQAQKEATTEEVKADDEATKFEALKEEAKSLGIIFAKNIGYKTLLQKVNAKKEELESSEEATTEEVKENDNNDNNS